MKIIRDSVVEPKKEIFWNEILTEPKSTNQTDTIKIFQLTPQMHITTGNKQPFSFFFDYMSHSEISPRALATNFELEKN